MRIHFWFGVGIGLEVIKRRNKSMELYLVLPFIRIRLTTIMKNTTNRLF